ncbi:MAG: outer membrane protein assembly factor BamD [Candidatus Korobacteraceae bacterium]
MFRRVIIAVLLGTTLFVAAGCTNKKVKNPIANVDSKQPDKVLYDRAMDAMKHGKYDVARLSLQTLINTYPDSEYVARAKLAIGDSWYAEGGSAAWTQAESEYKDFQTFFPNMPEAAEAQMKIANIHYKEMEKPDRDYTHAKRAEDEYRQLILQYPDSKLVPEAKQRLLEVQEVLAEREYMIGHFYFVRESYPAAIARLKSLVDTYPLYSDADDALYELGESYQKEIDVLRASRLTEAQKGGLMKQYAQGAVDAYSRIVTRYPLEPRAADAKKRLQAMDKPVPTASPEAIAQNKKEIESRGHEGMYGKLVDNFRHSPDTTEAVKVGEPTLVDPKQTSAPDFVRNAATTLMQGITGGAANPAGQAANAGTPPAAGTAAPANNAAGAEIVPNPSAGGASTTPGATVPSPLAPGTTPPANDANSAATDFGNDVAPASGSSAAAPASGGTSTPASSAPANGTSSDTSSGSGTTASSSATTTGSSASAQTPAATAANPDTESTSKKKKKHLWPF